MRVFLFVAASVLLLQQARPQGASFPLESVTIEGSSVPQAVILEMAGMHLTSPINKSGIEQACQKLQESGLFSSISYRYAPGAQKGYAVKLILADQYPLVAAVIDVPGADEGEAWQWLATKFGRFNRQVPGLDAAQKYLAGQIEAHLSGQLRGQHLTPSMEADLITRKMTVSIQPENLPRVRSVSFAGNQAGKAAELTAALERVLSTLEYTDRKFAAALDLNLRRYYEERGFYRARFTPGPPQFSSEGVSVAVTIAEGEPYRLGKVEVAGENLPVDALRDAAKFPAGKLANWKQIQDGIWEMERVLKRAGYMEAVAVSDRTYDDAAHVLDLRIRMRQGPLYHFGEVRFTGLTPDQEAKARGLWRAKAGDPYDYSYSGEFFQALSRTIDLRGFRKFQAVSDKATPEHVVGVNVVFEPK